MSRSLPPFLLLGVYDFRSSIQAFNPFWVDFCRWYKIRVHLNSFARGCPVFSAQFIEETVLSLLYSLGSFVEQMLTVYAWYYFWVLNSAPLTYVSIFMPVPYVLITIAL